MLGIFLPLAMPAGTTQLLVIVSMLLPRWRGARVVGVFSSCISDHNPLGLPGSTLPFKPQTG
jgi:hypothetical protein